MTDLAPTFSSLETPGLYGTETELLALMVETSGVQRNDQQQRVEAGFERLEELRHEIARALEAARQAEKHAGTWGKISSFLGGDLATTAEAVAAAALIAGSGGAATPLVLTAAAVVMSAAAKIGAERGLDPRLCAALTVVGAAAGALAGKVDPGSVSGVLGAVGEGASLTAGTATAGGGATGTVEGHYRAEALRAQADTTSAQGEVGSELSELDRHYAQLRALVAEDARAQGTVAETLSVRDRTHHSIIGHIGA
jgi:hypothetical protein